MRLKNDKNDAKIEMAKSDENALKLEKIVSLCSNPPPTTEKGNLPPTPTTSCNFTNLNLIVPSILTNPHVKQGLS